ncbi:hypothetical protein BD414DRAFT_506186 [Trametes punicea]|nr:hypothetical protein BD414DRAFT_506186 [Trametes punicea]
MTRIHHKGIVQALKASIVLSHRVGAVAMEISPIKLGITRLNTRQFVRSRGELDDTVNLGSAFVLGEKGPSGTAANRVEIPLTSIVFATASSVPRLTNAGLGDFEGGVQDKDRFRIGRDFDESKWQAVPAGGALAPSSSSSRAAEECRREKLKNVRKNILPILEFVIYGLLLDICGPEVFASGLRHPLQYARMRANP